MLDFTEEQPYPIRNIWPTVCNEILQVISFNCKKKKIHKANSRFRILIV